MPVPKKCTERECPYHADRGEVPYDGPAASDIVIVGESPGAEENRIGRPFSGISGRFLMALLRHIGKERGDVVLANASRCTIKKDTDSIKNQNLALKTCRKKLCAVLGRVRPKVIVALGGVALRQLTGKQKIMENRGKFFASEEFGCQIFATVHPAWVLRQGARDGFWDQPVERMNAVERLLFMDFEQVQKFLKDESTTGVDTTKYLRGTEKHIPYLKKAEVLAVDFETTGLDVESKENKVLSIGFSAEEGKSIVFLPDAKGKYPEGVLDLLRSDVTKVVAARPFEERVAKKLGAPMPPDSVHDVLSMAHVLDENFTGGYSLEKVADLFTGMKNIKALAQGKRANLEELDVKDLIKYNGADCDATLRAFHVLRRMLGADPLLANYYEKITQRMQGMFAELHHNGCLIDTAALGKAERELTAIAESAEIEALKLIPESIKSNEKHEGKLRLSRDTLVRDYLFAHRDGKKFKPNEKYLTPKKKEPQITEDHLKQFKSRFITLYLTNKKAKKILSTYLRKLWGQMRSDGRVYPNTIFTRTVTGRTVMIDPAIQTIPQRGEFAKHVKKVFVADDGWVMGARDLSQSEIRIVGWLAKDPNILGALAANVDVHTKTAAIINRVPVEQVTKDMRQKAKACIAEGELVTVSRLAHRLVDINRVSSTSRVVMKVPIQDVTCFDMVWDGEEWVTCDGAVYMGVREVMEYDGLRATPDHTIFLEGGDTRSFSEAAAKGLAVARGDDSFDEVRLLAGDRDRDYLRKAQKNYRSLLRVWKDATAIYRQRSLWADEELPLSARGEIRPRSPRRGFGRSLRRDLAANLQPGESVLVQLRREGNSTQVQESHSFHRVDAEEFTPPNVQECADRQAEQQRALRAGEFAARVATAELEQQADQCEGPFPICLDKCQSLMARAQDPVSLVPVRVRMDEQTGEKRIVRRSDPGSGYSPEGFWKGTARVYDILNAGPRHRFTVQGQIVSNCNFGFIYGMSAKKFQGYAKDEYGIELSLDQCEAVRMAFFAHPSGYYKLLDFHRKQEQEAISRGYVRSPIGRIRRLPNAQQNRDRMAMGEALRQGINFPVQSFSSDLGLIGMYLFWRWVKKHKLEKKVKIMWFIHDAVVFQAQGPVFARAMKALKWCMEVGSVRYVKKHFGVEVGYPVASDGKAGKSWADLKEYCDVCGEVKMLGDCPSCEAVQKKAREDAEKKAKEEAAAAGRTRVKRTLFVN